MIKRFLGFILTFAALFALTLGFLSLLGLTPDPVGSEDASNGTGPTEVAQQPVTNTAVSAVGEPPVRVAAKDIGLSVSVSNPTDTDANALDQELLHGAIRYPGTALPGTAGTVLLFGHSSYLPIVHNQNFKAFNGIQKLKTGAIVSVYSASHEYRYAVTGVRLANANEDVIELPAQGQHLTLVTCDSFGTKSDRYVVTADLEGVYNL